MAELRGRSVRAAIVWTVVAIAAGVGLAAIAGWRLNEAQQACFFDSTVPCPGGADLLPFAFFGIPALWLVGLAAIAIAAGVERRSHRR